VTSTTASAARPPRNRTRAVVAISAVVIAVIVIAFFAFSSLYADVLWYQQLGYLNVLTTQWTATIVMFLVGFLAMGIGVESPRLRVDRPGVELGLELLEGQGVVENPHIAAPEVHGPARSRTGAGVFGGRCGGHRSLVVGHLITFLKRDVYRRRPARFEMVAPERCTPSRWGKSSRTSACAGQMSSWMTRADRGRGDAHLHTKTEDGACSGGKPLRASFWLMPCAHAVPTRRRSCVARIRAQRYVPVPS
jgi:hypothetical protein